MRHLTTLPLLLCSTAVLAEVPSVVTDTAPVHALVSIVMGDLGQPAMLIPPGTSPHDAALRPSDAAALSGADIVIWTGPGLVPMLEAPIGTLAGGAVQVALLTTPGWTALPVRTDPDFADAGHDHGHGAEAEGAAQDEHDHGAHEHGHDEHDHAQEQDHDAHDHEPGDDHDEAAEGAAAGGEHDDHDHDEHEHEHEHDDHAGQGHDHGADGVDPHAWLDPAVGAVWLDTIAQSLAAADPDNGPTYLANAATAAAGLTALRARLVEDLAPLAGRPYVVPHDGYQYFEVAFGLPAVGAIALSDAAAPGPAHIAELKARIAAEGIRCVLADPQTSPDLTALVIEGTGARTAIADPDGQSLTPGPDLYVALVEGVAAALQECLARD